jgi:excisionase family DNA binding protein
MTNDFPDIMGMGDVASYLRVSRQHVDRLVASGKLRCKKTSTGKVFLRADVIVFREERLKKLRQPKKRVHKPKR